MKLLMMKSRWLDLGSLSVSLSLGEPRVFDSPSAPHLPNVFISSSSQLAALRSSTGEYSLATGPFLAQITSLLCRIADVKPGATQSGLALPFRCWYRYMAEVPAILCIPLHLMSLRPVHFNSNNLQTSTKREKTPSGNESHICLISHLITTAPSAIKSPNMLVAWR